MRNRKNPFSLKIRNKYREEDTRFATTRSPFDRSEECGRYNQDITRLEGALAKWSVMIRRDKIESAEKRDCARWGNIPRSRQTYIYIIK